MLRKKLFLIAVIFLLIIILFISKKESGQPVNNDPDYPDKQIFTISINEEDINDLIEQRVKNYDLPKGFQLKSQQLKLYPNKIILELRLHYKNIPINITLQGHLQVKEKEILIVFEQAKLGKIPIPENLLKKFLE